ncbi:MAG TPA: terminase, partial [Dysgonomonas sp.]|nr:terminase [Dysgonomonas sp.]
ANLLYEKGIPRQTPVIADSAEPKSIREIRSMGWLVEGADKGKDSIDLGLSLLNRYVKHVTASSLNIISEYRNYRWQTDENGYPTNRPADKYNHAVDAQRYVVFTKLYERRGKLSYSIIK